MRLSQIKLSGFKSFVDTTVLHFPTNLTGVVGPNGCGKSNVIDAVRWVMGESSAKYLRGDSLADVIFNGSSARKPVGVAAIELMFDNADGAIGGPFAQFSEVSVKRSLSRDGVSVYYINGARCRRRDITGLFLGTGLGPRSYSIIEQGMVSRLIEARPEDTRAYLEEAAGISRYKEKRRETENRIRHTRENLERLTDLRDEVEKQLKHLQRQARVAERYKDYRQRQRRMQAELTLLRLRELDGASALQRQHVDKHQVAVDAALAEQRAVESQIESSRERLGERQEAQREVQERYYKQGAEIARLEQEISHSRDLRERQEREIERLTKAMAEIDADIAADQQLLDTAAQELESLTPALAAAREREQASDAAMEHARSELADWQTAWDQWAAAANAAEQTVSVEDTRQSELNIRARAAGERLARLNDARASLSVGDAETAVQQAASEVEAAEATLGSLRDQLAQSIELLDGLREQSRQLTEELHTVRLDLEASEGRVSSLEALQQAALGADGDGIRQWLRERSLDGRPRLAQVLQVEAGWETAVEAVLAHLLEAVCVEDLSSLVAADALPEGDQLALFQQGRSWPASTSLPLHTLASKLGGAVVPASLMAGVYCADSLDEANRHAASLGAGESIITADGKWVGPDWFRTGQGTDERVGVIAREQTLREQREQRDQLAARRLALQERDETLRAELARTDTERATLQDEVNRAHSELAQARGRNEACESRIAQVQERLQALESESAELQEQSESIRQAMAQSAERAAEARSTLDSLRDRESELRQRKTALSSRFEQEREHSGRDRAQAQALALQVESRTAQQSSLHDAMARLRTQRNQYQASHADVVSQLEDSQTPIEALEQRLDALLQERSNLERELTEASGKVEEADAEVRRLLADRGEREEAVGKARELLDKQRLRMQEIVTLRGTCAEDLEKTGLTAEEIAEHLPDEAAIEPWESELETLEHRIQRLGPINLAAIDEFETQSERKEYLDAQHTDLTQALETLEAAMRKIDRETRTRFKETFDKVDAGLKRIFPRLFGGGHAYLELSDTDLLDAGVTVMARPPGKRNSTIHLLSGGEKAMTAVALIFAIFELNPAPFCMLDEVDAPLDDANVGRFCEIVKEMSERVQFIFITHNKVTMELASHLSGVTMQEPGVSRLVAVDVDEAVRLAAM
jgi:chromosome segregation protein